MTNERLRSTSARGARMLLAAGAATMLPLLACAAADALSPSAASSGASTPIPSASSTAASTPAPNAAARARLERVRALRVQRPRDGVLGYYEALAQVAVGDGAAAVDALRALLGRGLGIVPARGVG